MSEKKDVSKILYNYNLLDDYFIDQDVSTNVGEIFVQQPDANVSISPNDKEMYFQMKKLTTAVDKIWKGYLSAYDKTTYKRQFDLYPLRDFDEYMASLGAKRSSDKKDFESVGSITDWLALVKKEKDIRTSDFKKADEERQKQEKEQQILDKEKQIEEAKKKNEQSSKKEQINTSPQKDATNVSTNTQINTNPDLTRFGVEEEKLNKENYSKIKEKLNEQNKALEENQSSDAGLTVERIKQRDETAKLLQESTKFFEGKIIEEKKQKTITSAMNPYELKISKGFDGFHTQGPFCLEKRKYFIEIFRPSISHWETEFREAEHDPQNVKDEGNDILKNTHTFVKSPLEDNTPTNISADLNTIVNQENKTVNVSSLDLKLKNIQIPGDTFKEPIQGIISGTYELLGKWNEIVSLPARPREFYSMIESAFFFLLDNHVIVEKSRQSHTIKNEAMDYNITMNKIKEFVSDLQSNQKGSHFLYTTLYKITSLANMSFTGLNKENLKILSNNGINL